MSDIANWSSSAAGNNDASPDGFPEGMNAAGLNDSSREVMAAVKRYTLAIAPNYINGLVLSNNTLDSNHDIDISPGATMVTSGLEMMILGSTLTKRIDAAWSVGSGAGGLDTGTVAADTLYALWLITDSDADVVDATFSTSFTFAGVSKPTGYGRGQLIGAVRTQQSAADIKPFTHRGDMFEYVVPVTDTSSLAVLDDNPTLVNVAVPPDCEWHGTILLENIAETNTHMELYVWRTGDDQPTNSNQALIRVDASAEAQDRLASAGRSFVNSSSNINVKASVGAGSATVDVTTKAFRMYTRGAGS